MHRDENAMFLLIKKVAEKYKDILAVVLNGSRCNLSIKPDKYQDYDLLFIVNDVSPFVHDKHWLDEFGERLIMQEPDSMNLSPNGTSSWPKNQQRYAFLMQFFDGNRIDLTLINYEHYHSMHKDSLSKVLLDKDNLFPGLPTPSEKDYLPIKPKQIDFSNCVNEFFWVSTYVAKGLLRDEIIYAKSVLEQNVRPMLQRLLIWKAAIDTGWSKNMGAHGKYLHKYLDSSLYLCFEKTYCDASKDSNWTALLSMTSLFNQVACEIKRYFNFQYDESESQAVIQYLKTLRANSKEGK